MYCQTCGAAIADRAKVCDNCGEKFVNMRTDIYGSLPAPKGVAFWQGLSGGLAILVTIVLMLGGVGFRWLKIDNVKLSSRNQELTESLKDAGQQIYLLEEKLEGQTQGTDTEDPAAEEESVEEAGSSQ